MNHDQTISDKVYEAVGKGEMFTSVDIANAIKTDGTWVRNSEVAHWLRNWHTFNDGYTVTRIPVTAADTQQTVSANLYLPQGEDSANYVKVTQPAMTPDEFKALHGVDPTGSAAPASAPDGDGGSDDAADASVSVSATITTDGNGIMSQRLAAKFNWPQV